MRRVYVVLGWGIVLLGLVHVLSTPRSLTPASLWFASGGLAMILTGLLNLLNHSYGGRAPGLYRVCLGVNVVMVAFAALSGFVYRAAVGQYAIVLGLFGGAAVVGAFPRSLRPQLPGELGP